ncbi:MAG TPA: Imm26 family immunity protein [Pyrinomonadaceae bacterium]|nr:Imm26 family immunity protein [Pyrinomonadaceae bacterium]
MVRKRKEPAEIAAAGLREISESFSDEIGRRPSSEELCEILTWAVRVRGEESFADAHPLEVESLQPQLKKGAVRPGANGKDDSAVADLNDSSFVIAGTLIDDVVGAVKKQTGRAPTVSRLCEILVEGLHLCDGEELLSDVAPAEVRGIKAVVRKQTRASAKVGDIVAIPAKNGEFFIAVVLTKNQFGVAYGLFRGTSRIKPISIRSHPPALRHAIYSGDLAMAGGRWKVIGHDKDLLSLFPARPEIYHAQDPDDPELGRYGAGETVEGELRKLSKDEAEELGLLSGEYRQVRLPDGLEDYLNSRLEKD